MKTGTKRWPPHHVLRAAAALLFACSQAFGYATSTDVRPPPDYDTFQPPPVGGTYVDPVFGATIKRVSDARNTPNAAGGSGTVSMIANEYSTMSPFNLDNSRFLLIHQSYFGLYDGVGNFLRNLPLEITPTSEPRWSRRDPNLLYFVRGNQLKQYDAATQMVSVIRSFAEYGAVSGHGESDICFDGDHLVLAGDGREIFVYEISTGRKGPVLSTGGRGFDSLYITPDDHVTVTWWQPGSGRYQGIELFDRQMNFLRQLTRAGGHMDVTRDANGDEVLVWANAGDPLAICNNGVVKVRLYDGAQTCLLSLDWSLAIHVSAPDGGGWAVVSSYASSDPRPPGGWRSYTNEILQVRLDGSEVRRLAHHRSRPHNDYWWSPRASASRDGSRLLFTSNYGLPFILGYPSAYTDAYLMSLRFEENERAVQCWPCPWFGVQHPVLSQAGARLSMDTNSQLILTFVGNGVSWIGYRDPWAGIARVYVDGIYQREVDTYASASQPQSVMYTIDGLAPGTHHLGVEVTGGKHAESAGAWVWVDAFDVLLPGGGTTRVEEKDPGIQCWPCLWVRNTHPVHSGGSAAQAMSPGAQTFFTFTGTGVRWIGYRDQWSGIARVSVDGIFQGEIDTYASAAQAQAVLFATTSLSPGQHWLTIEVTGNRNLAASGSWVWVDAFEVTL